MTEWPKFASDGSGENGGRAGGYAQKPKLSLWTRVRLRAVLLLICAIPVGLAVGGGFWMRRALRPGMPWEDTLYYLLIGVMYFVPLGLVVRISVRTRIQTGRWTMTAEARAERARQRAAGQGAGGVCGARGVGA